MEHIFYGFKGIVTDTVGNPIKAKVTLVGVDYDSSEVYSDVVTGFYNRMVQPGNYRLRFQAQGYQDYLTDFYQISNYTSTITINAQMIPIIVPVELVSFDAFVDKNDVVLKWNTATELNNMGFDIERRNENGEFEYVGFLRGKGTTSEYTSYSFVDKGLDAGKYYYRLKQKDYDGSYDYSRQVEVNVTTPMEYSLEQNYPNPFNPTTRIKYSLKEKNYVTLKVYDVLGIQVANLVDEVKEAGQYELLYNASNLSSGVYYYTLTVDNFTSTKKFVLMK
jgi:hypothetical protein